MIQSNPRLAESALNGDPRMFDVIGALMGIDIQGTTNPDDLPAGFDRDPAATPSPAPTPASSAPPPPKPAAPTPKPAPAPAPAAEDVEMTEEEQEEAKAKAAAEAEKAKGAAAYKARDFASARDHFSKAWELWPKDATFLTNLGAVYFEMGEYDEAIATCEKAVDAGREVRAAVLRAVDAGG
jgi:stress-induced-phosphoprotein 1